jgi:hypothetical protein
VPEPTTNLSRDDLESEVGIYLGYGAGALAGDVAWSAEQQADVRRVMQIGVNLFTQPAEAKGVPAGYEWTFLRPTIDLELASGADSLPLPAEVAGLDGKVTVVSETGGYCPVAVTNAGMVQVLRARSPTLAGRPDCCAVRPLRGTGADRGQRFELAVYPAADAAYTLRAAVVLVPDALSGARPFAYGGAVHAETLRAAVVAAAELFKDDTRGPRWQHFQERLAVSVALDRGRAGERHGYNGDRSDALAAGRGYGRNRFTATFQGVEYD